MPGRQFRVYRSRFWGSGSWVNMGRRFAPEGGAGSSPAEEETSFTSVSVSKKDTGFSPPPVLPGMA